MAIDVEVKHLLESPNVLNFNLDPIYGEPTIPTLNKQADEPGHVNARCPYVHLTSG